ncbi:MAG: aminoacyl-tRNA hydrolase [Veillonellaceae bacterium]|nr:aminoacyl-tRNA hydrolase [Veillonellaceae bacterium]
MKLIVGLGNPGDKYERTRHNVGFLAVDGLAAELGVYRWREEHAALTASVTIAGEKALLVKPQTFMNLSGDAVGALSRYYKVAPADIIVIYDDMDLPVGRLRIRAKGSAGGHNGMKSVIAHLGTNVFPHVRIGIGRPQLGRTVIEHVLLPPLPTEQAAVTEAIAAAGKVAIAICRDGLDLAMNRFNPLYSR